MNATTAIQTLQQLFPGQVGDAQEFRSEYSVTVALSRVAEVASQLKNLGFNFLLDVTTIDHADHDPRFEIVYEFYHLEAGTHLRVKAPIREEEQTLIPTLSHLYPTANWHEREAYDMMGLKFTGHPDLRRILMWEGYPYFPLRKEFPLEGKPSDLPDIAFTKPAPLAGGPFVTSPSSAVSERREPRSKAPDVA